MQINVCRQLVHFIRKLLHNKAILSLQGSKPRTLIQFWVSKAQNLAPSSNSERIAQNLEAQTKSKQFAVTSG